MHSYVLLILLIGGNNSQWTITVALAKARKDFIELHWSLLTLDFGVVTVVAALVFCSCYHPWTTIGASGGAFWSRFQFQQLGSHNSLCYTPISVGGLVAAGLDLTTS